MTFQESTWLKCGAYAAATRFYRVEHGLSLEAYRAALGS